MKNKWLMYAFVGMVLIQWFVPIQMIYQKQITVSKGNEFKFKIIPVDPIDPLRGRYLALSFDQNAFTLDSMKYYDNSVPLFAEINNDNDGFGFVKQLYFENKPPSTTDFIQINDFYTIQNDSTSTIHYTLPFSRFYVNEKEAPRLEKEYLEALRDSSKVCYAKVFVHNGQAIMKELIVE
jgi:uncharacterized membrane-anchored protein